VIVDIFDVEDGQCAIIYAPDYNRIAMIDVGHNSDPDNEWEPSTYLKSIGRTQIDYLYITNADEDHFSHLADLRKNGITVNVFVRNWKVSAERIEEIKTEQCALSNDAKEYMSMMRTYIHPVEVPFNDGMGGIKAVTFCCGGFDTTNALSMAVFLEYKGFEILFPGDLTYEAWMELLKDPQFVAHLKNTNVLVAAHHGREDGYCEEIFEYFSPQLVIFSDKKMMYDTQETASKYRAKAQGAKVGEGGEMRYVLTTRNDGDIRITVGETNFKVETGQIKVVV